MLLQITTLKDTISEQVIMTLSGESVEVHFQLL